MSYSDEDTAVRGSADALRCAHAYYAYWSLDVNIQVARGLARVEHEFVYEEFGGQDDGFPEKYIMWRLPVTAAVDEVSGRSVEYRQLCPSVWVEKDNPDQDVLQEAGRVGR